MAPRRYLLLALDPRESASVEATASEAFSPRVDHVEIVRVLGATRMSFEELERAPRSIRLMARALGRSAALGFWAASLVRDDDSVLSSGEDVGLWFDLAARLRRRRPVHTLVAHHLGTARKRLWCWAVRPMLRRVVTYCPAQADWARKLFRLPPHRVELLPFQVDADFFATAERRAPDRPLLVSIGREARDFETLFAAVTDLPVEVVISAHSPWRPARAPSERPSNVEQRRPSYAGLRDLYASCQIVIVPVHEVDYAAGLNAIVEGLAAGRPVIATAHRGRPHWLRHEQNCLLYSTGNVADLRRCIVRLLDQPELARRLGKSGRRLVDRGIDQQRHADRMRRVVERAERPDSHRSTPRGAVSCPS